MRMLNVKVRAIKGLKYAEIAPNVTATLVGGENGAGKSSLLDAVCMALGGARLIPDTPIRDGEDTGEVVVTLKGDPDAGIQDMVVKRTFVRRADGSIDSELSIRSADGFRAGRCQELLDSLIGRIGFDPLAFLRLKRDEQAKQLLDLLGIDLSDLNRQRKVLYEKRRDVGVRGKAERGVLDSIPVVDDVPESAPDLDALNAALATKRADRELIIAFNSEAKSKHAAVQQEVIRLVREVSDTEREIEKLSSMLAAANARVEKLRLSLSDARNQESIGVAVQYVPDLTDLEAAVEHGRQAIERIKLAERRAKQEQIVEACKNEWQELTVDISKIDEEKKSRIAAANWPLSDLSYNEDAGELTWNGRPLSQASTAEQTTVAVAIGAASGKALNVMFVREGSLLDQKHLLGLAQLAGERGCQLLIERVGEGSENDIVIREGEVVANATIPS